MSPISPALPAGSQLGFSYEYGVDVNVGTVAIPVWQPIRRPSAIAPGVAAKTADAQTYDDFGADNADRVSESFTLAFSVLVNRLASGLYAPEVEKLKSYTEPDAVGNLAVCHVRWYDKPVSGSPNPDDAYEGFATVSIDRGATGNAEAGSWSITLTGKGKRTKIANPFAGWDAAVPAIASILPVGKSIGDQVTITGTNFIGVTQVKFDAIVLDVDTYTVVGASTIVATIPATAAGVEPVTVTNATGISVAVNYTVV